MALAALALAITWGCGSGGSGDGDVGNSSLAIRARWEQPGSAPLRAAASSRVPRRARPQAQSLATRLPGRRDSSFGTTIPAAVNTVRITLTPGEGSSVPACCVAVPRGSQAFIDRRLVISGLPPGDVLVRISGYPTAFAPSDGIGATCATSPSGAGASCDGRDALPSFASNDVPVAVVPGQQASTGDVGIASLPFLLDVSPGEGTLVNVPDVPISFAVVSANNTIVAGSIGISLQAGNPPQTFGATIQSTTPCNDRVTGGRRCTTGPDLDVAGVLVNAVSDPVPAGPARIIIDAQDNAGRSVTFAYDVNVQPGATTTLPPTTTTLPPPTTTTATTPTSSTTQTTLQTTTTTAPTTTSTLPPAFTCAVTFGVTSNETLLGLEYTTDYNAAPGRFQRPSEGQGCVSIRQGVFLVQSVDSEPNRLLLHQLNSSTPFANPGPLVKCNFLTDDTAALAPSDFVIQSVQGTDAQNNPVTPTVAVTNVDCGGGTTTTAPVTTTSTVTTSTVTTTTVTTTTLPTTTTSTSTTTTTGTTPTSTLPGFLCTLPFAILNTETFERIDWELNYQQANGRFFRKGESLRCASGDPNSVLMFVLDNPTSQVMDSRVQTPLGFTTPGALAVCLFLTDNGALSPSDFTVNVLSAVRPDGTPASAQLQLFQITCAGTGGGGGTTTTTLASSVDNCDITFGWTTSDVIASLEWRANYTETNGRFEGFTSDVQCTALVAVAGQGLEDKEDGNLVALMEAPSGIQGPADVARCRYKGPAPAGFEGAISVSTLLAEGPTGAPSNAVMTITKVQCGL